MEIDEAGNAPQRDHIVRSGRLQQRSRAAFLRIYLLQFLLLLLITAGAWVQGRVTAYSALFGGLLYLIPNLYFTWRVLYSKRPAETAQQVVISLYASEIGKMLVAALLFSVVFLLVQPLSPFSLFLTFILLQLSGWMLQWRLGNRFLKL